MRAPAVYQVFVPACILVLAFLAGLGWYGAKFSPLRRALPWAAHGVYEQVFVDAPRYEILLRASLTPGEFAAYVRRLELTPHTAERRYDGDPDAALSWRPIQEAPPWWTPADELGELYVWQSGNAWTFAKLEEGVAFIRAFTP